MFTRLRRHLGTAGLLVAVVALVAALGGGAVAAQSGGDATASAKKKKKGKQGGLNAKQKRQVIGLIKKNGGGPAGPAGPAGQNGAPGANGAAGGAGPAGANGKTVLSGTATPGAGIGTIGDFYMDTDDSVMYGPKAAFGANGGWGAGSSLRGAAGSPWTMGGVLPKDATLTGTWTSGAQTNNTATLGMLPEGQWELVPISFGVQVNPAPTLVSVSSNPSTGAFDSDADAGCPGVVGGVPQAGRGKFCVYGAGYDFGGGNVLPSATVGSQLPGPNPAPAVPFGPGVTPAGTQLKLSCPSSPFGSCVVNGLWAVTSGL